MMLNVLLKQQTNQFLFPSTTGPFSPRKSGGKLQLANLVEFKPWCEARLA
jgi:hypothetical protein